VVYTGNVIYTGNVVYTGNVIYTGNVVYTGNVPIKSAWSNQICMVQLNVTGSNPVTCAYKLAIKK